MNGEVALTVVGWLAAAWLIISTAAIVWAAGTIFQLRGQIRRLRRPAQVPRDANGRPLKERL